MERYRHAGVAPAARTSASSSSRPRATTSTSARGASTRRPPGRSARTWACRTSSSCSARTSSATSSGWIPTASGSPCRWRWSASRRASSTSARWGCRCASATREAAEQAVRLIARREGFGDVLADGVRAAAAQIGAGRRALRPARQGPGDGAVRAADADQPGARLCDRPGRPAIRDLRARLGLRHRGRLAAQPGAARTLGVLERSPMQKLAFEKVARYKALNTIWSGGRRARHLDLRHSADPPARPARPRRARRRGDRLGDLVLRADALRREAQPPHAHLQRARGPRPGGRHAAGPLLRRAARGRASGRDCGSTAITSTSASASTTR